MKSRPSIISLLFIRETTTNLAVSITLLNASGIVAVPSTLRDAPVTPFSFTVLGEIFVPFGKTALLHMEYAAPVSAKQLTNVFPTSTDT